MNDPVAVGADAYARWHASWLDALGIPSRRDAGAWHALERPPVIYLAGVALAADLEPTALAEAPGAVGAPWQTLDLSTHGRRIWRTEPWFYRSPGPVPDTAPSELDVIEVSTADEVYEFEAVSVCGFVGEDASVPPGTYHPPAILEDDEMKMFIGRVDGRPVAAAMGYVTDHAVGVFGVTTIASARGRGYGTALTCAAMLTDTGLPAVLAPSPEAEGLYRRLGFEPVGELRIWVTDP